MDEESKPGWLKWGLGLVGLGAIAGSATISIWIAVIILLLAVLLFGGLLFLRRWSRKRSGRRVIENVGQESSQAVTEAERRAELDNLLERFKSGLKEFDRAGYSVYDYPWFVVIGESGAGKTEAVRSALEDQVPSTVRHHIPPRDKGTKDFVWWFTKHGIVLDTAGRMVVGEGGASKDEAWRLFLKSLRKSRPRCPINGLLLALSAESLIKDSAEKISDKATQLAQKIEMIQRELDVRFPVYLLVTKCDLLTGFREFTAKIDDPQLQHQMFGWSNPVALDESFNPEQVLGHLTEIVEQVKRRRLALLRPADGRRLGDTDQFFAAGFQLGQGGAPRRLDEMDSLFVFAESLLLLEPRLRRYLDTIFVGEAFSTKQAFLRGIYFTSAMREGRALDEAMSLITGVGLENLPEDRAWERNKSFFLRDLFVEKVVREKGLVTRAKNTLQALRQQRFLIFGTASAALLLLLVFAYFGYRSLVKDAREADRLWSIAANSNNWVHGEWSPPIVKLPSQGYRYSYNGQEAIPSLDKVTLVDFHSQLHHKAEVGIKVPVVFKLFSWLSGGPNKNAVDAQRAVLLAGVLKPLFARTRDKMQQQELSLADPSSLQRHQQALVELIRLEADALKPLALDSNRTLACFRGLLSYLTETNVPPDTNLVNLIALAYRDKDSWPPKSLTSDANLSNNPAIDVGLQKLKTAGNAAQKGINSELNNLKALVAALNNRHVAELGWVVNPRCDGMNALKSSRDDVFASWAAIGDSTNLTQRYQMIKSKALGASASPIAAEVSNILAQVPEPKKPRSIVMQVAYRLQEFSKDALDPMTTWYSGEQQKLKMLDDDLRGAPPAFEARWRLYTNACALQNAGQYATRDDVGRLGEKYQEIAKKIESYKQQLRDNSWALSVETSNACNMLAEKAVIDLKSDYVSNYVDLVSQQLRSLSSQQDWDGLTLTNARAFISDVLHDIESKNKLEPEDQRKVAALSEALPQTKAAVLGTISANFEKGLRFPVKLNGGGADAEPSKELAHLRKLAGVLITQLDDSIWREVSQASALQQKCKVYEPVLSMLVGPDGNAIEWKLFFVGPQTSSPADATIVAIFRNLQVSGMQQLDDLSSVGNKKQEIGVARADAGLTLEFRKSRDSQLGRPALKFNDWWIARLLASNSDPTWDGDGGYRFRIPLEDQGIKGNVTFEVSPKDPTIHLPKFKYWQGAGN